MSTQGRTVRIIVTSDLHYDSSGYLTPPAEIGALVERIAAAQPDAVVIAGDLAHGAEEFRRCVACFAGLSVPVMVLAGNHDVWADREAGISSADLWHRVLPEVTQEAGALWLEAANGRVGHVAVVGSMVWYDYSAIAPALDLPVQEIAATKRFLNNDAHWIDWDYSDPELAAILCNGLRERLEAASRDPGVEKILLVTHVPVLEPQMLRKPGDEQWSLSNAYFGNLTTGRMILEFPKIAAVISGHTHVGRRGLVQRAGSDPLECFVVPSDYNRPETILIEL